MRARLLLVCFISTRKLLLFCAHRQLLPRSGICTRHKKLRLAMQLASGADEFENGASTEEQADLVLSENGGFYVAFAAAFSKLAKPGSRPSKPWAKAVARRLQRSAAPPYVAPRPTNLAITNLESKCPASLLELHEWLAGDPGIHLGLCTCGGDSKQESQGSLQASNLRKIHPKSVWHQSLLSCLTGEHAVGCKELDVAAIRKAVSVLVCLVKRHMCLAHAA